MTDNKRYGKDKITIDQLLGQDDVKALLNKLTKECDKRCITSLVVAWVDSKGDTAYDACGNSMLQLMGMCEWAKIGLMAELNDNEQGESEEEEEENE